MRFLSITYHYMGDYGLEYQGISSLSASRFIRQLEEIGQNFEFISQETLLNALENRTVLPENSCLLTFDDGLKSQFEVAVPILEQMKIPAVFFLCGLPYDRREVLTIHKIHWLRSILDPNIFIEKIVAKLEMLGSEFSWEMFDPDKIADKFFWDDLETKKIKYLLNVVLPPALSKQCVDLLFDEYVGSQEQFCDDFYLSESEVRCLHEHFAVGVHSYSHQVLGRMGRDSVRAEIRRNIDVVSTMISASPKGISYPYGYKEAVTPMVAEIARQSGLAFGFTVERSFNVTLHEPLLLARIDTNDAPAGKKPVFEMIDGGVEIKELITPSRERYFAEPETLS